MSARVKHFSSTLQRALGEERHFTLVEGVAFPTVGSLVIHSGQDTRSDPCISSVTTLIMITSSNSSAKRSGLPNQLLGVGLHTTAWSGLARVRTELFPLLVIPPPAPHPIQSNRQAPGHRDLGDLPPPAHHQVEILAAPFRKATCCNLGSFHQQEAQHRTPLFGDVP